MRFDLFKLYISKEDVGARSQISCSGKNLIPLINGIIEEITSCEEKIYDICKKLAKDLGCHPDTILKMLRKRNETISIIVIKKLLDEWKIICKKSELDSKRIRLKIQNEIEYLYCGSSYRTKLKAVKELGPTLSKIVGAHHADGCLFKEKSKNGMNYKFCIIDGYKSNLYAFKKWMFELFSINLKVRKAKSNAWIIETKNKIFGRYLEIFFGFPCGDKTFYNMPELIKESSINIKEAYVLGFVTFDGCVETDKNVSLGIKNKILRDEICEIFPKNLIFKKRESKGAHHFRSGVPTTNQLKMWKNFFEENTEKWFKIDDFINGFSKKMTDENKAIRILDKTYVHSKLISIKSIIEILKEVKCADKFYLSKKSGISASAIFKYLKILETSNVVQRTNTPKCFPKVSHDIEDVRVELSKELHSLIFSKFKNYSKEEICDCLNICETTYRNWENKKFGKINISKLFLIKDKFKLKINMNKLRFGKKLFEYNENNKNWLIPDRPWFNY